jgi:energy-coupling factor transport system ATP-binding protein
VVRHGPVVAVRGTDLVLNHGQIVALMGRNGSGKSSLLWALQGSGKRDSGTVAAAIGLPGNANPRQAIAAATGTAPRQDVAAAAGKDPRQAETADPKKVPAAQARKLVGLVPQTATDLLYLDTVAAELAQADRDGAIAGTARGLLDAIAPGISDDAHPRDLSAGQQLALVLAVQLAVVPGVVLLDEPTRGLDYSAKAGLARTLDTLAAAGHAIVVATHDVEFATIIADRVVVMAEGEIVSDGPAPEVLTASPSFAPQIAKILAPLPYLTLAQVQAAQ